MKAVFKDNIGVQEENFVEYAYALPFATVVEDEKKSFEVACPKCHGVLVDAFFNERDELKISEYYAMKKVGV